jgi:nucleotide-binding universal stress UspA family protein
MPEVGTDSAAPFPSILCGVEGDRASTDAAWQAIALAAPGAALHFIAVYTTFRLPKYSEEALQESLEEAAQLAGEAGISASTELARGRHAVDILLPESEHHDLLVLGSHSHSRAAGIMIGSTASKAAHDTQRPLLITRGPTGPDEFPRNILLASDGSPGSWAAVRTAAAIAAAFNAPIEIVHVVDGTHPERHPVLNDQITEIREVIGEEPGLTEPAGHPTQAIIEAARVKESSLVVSGRRGLHGIRALGSVSERIVHRAPCSVLLIPAGDAVSDA